MNDMNDKWNKSLKDAYERDKRIHEKPVSKQERDSLQKKLQNPKYTYHLEPDGSTRREVDHKQSSEHARRINHIDKRLNRVKNKPKRDFERCR